MWLPRERRLQETVTLGCQLFWTVQYKKQNARSNLSNKINADDSRLLGCDITSLCELFPTFQRNLRPSSSRVRSARGVGVLDCLTLDDESTMVPQIVGTSRPMTQQHVPDDLHTVTFNETCTDTCFLLHLICMSHITLSYKILIFFPAFCFILWSQWSICKTLLNCYKSAWTLMWADKQLTRRWSKEYAIVRETQLSPEWMSK
jgi:hypothetical protein